MLKQKMMIDFILQKIKITSFWNFVSHHVYQTKPSISIIIGCNHICVSTQQWVEINVRTLIIQYALVKLVICVTILYLLSFSHWWRSSPIFAILCTVFFFKERIASRHLQTSIKIENCNSSMDFNGFNLPISMQNSIMMYMCMWTNLYPLETESIFILYLYLSDCVIRYIFVKSEWIKRALATLCTNAQNAYIQVLLLLCIFFCTTIGCFNFLPEHLNQS